ncbi:hypothetical protein K438DRAFT_1981923 [Mycena galopus ATCC 62051]|nr:hypothetical protein K438DRAFT_1981923 [Mycena galopus ATCC 62051]
MSGIVSATGKSASGTATGRCARKCMQNPLPRRFLARHAQVAFVLYAPGPGETYCVCCVLVGEAPAPRLRVGGQAVTSFTITGVTSVCAPVREAHPPQLRAAVRIPSPRSPFQGCVSGDNGIVRHRNAVASVHAPVCKAPAPQLQSAPLLASPTIAGPASVRAPVRKARAASVRLQVHEAAAP